MQTFESNEALLAHFDAHRIPAAAVIDPADAHLDPWFEERGAIVTVEDPHFGPITMPGFPLHGSAIPDRGTEPLAPLLGQHNVEVLREVLGWDDERIDGLTNDGVLLSAPVVATD